MNDIILHICPRATWENGEADYRGDTLDTEGFIHCSTLAQMERTANRFFAGQRGLVVLHIDTRRLTAPLKWEPSEGVDFPHIYGPLNRDAVIHVEALEPDAAGMFRYPHT
ncbi:MAG: DUF952 domain-containing protein [Anaerolineae bacterium]|nr:MAG: DUF952 domain-containing protein [Anaerolineae bacterium]